MRTGRHIIVTGGAGYIGSVLVEALLRRGDWVTVVDNLLYGGESLLNFFPNPAFHFMRGDVCEAGEIQRAAREAEACGAPPVSAIVHLAAIVGFPACKAAGRDVVWRTNVDAVRQVFRDADDVGAERMLFSSTYSVYGMASDEKPVIEQSQLKPQSLYAETKVEAENVLLQSSQAYECFPLIFRFATLYGASSRLRFDLIVNQFVLQAYTQGSLLIYQPGYSRAFVHVRDVIAGILLGLEAPEECARDQVFNLGARDGNYSKDEIVELILRVLPETQVRYENLAFSGDMRDIRVSFEKIHKVLGFETQWTVPQGIDEILLILKTGLIRDPYDERYRNAPFIVNDHEQA
jgi:nucleoside-diphosphate-sugar epimerase